MRDPYVETVMQAAATGSPIKDGTWLGKQIAGNFWGFVVERAYVCDKGITAWCGRCGERVPCHHLNCSTITDADHAERIRARYAFGKLYNPDHDTATYTDPTP